MKTGVASLLNPLAARSLMDQVAAEGWAVSTDLLAEDLCLALAKELHVRQASGHLRPAAVGRGQTSLHRPSLRGDSIQWLENEANGGAVSLFLSAMDELMACVRRELYIPVRTFESHFAIYEAGRSYAKHRDRFRDADERELSTVLFLNADWQPEDEGQLCLYDPLDESTCLQAVLPSSGTFVLFRSELMPHEVKPPQRSRFSIAGWMRRDGLSI